MKIAIVAANGRVGKLVAEEAVLSGGVAAAAAEAGLRTLQIALGIAGGIVIASVLGIIFRPRSKAPRNR